MTEGILDKMGLFDGLEGTVEECLKRSRPGIFHLIIKPEFAAKFQRFYETGHEGTLIGEHEKQDKSDEGFAMKLGEDGELVTIPYSEIEKYERLGPY